MSVSSPKRQKVEVDKLRQQRLTDFFTNAQVEAARLLSLFDEIPPERPESPSLQIPYERGVLENVECLPCNQEEEEEEEEEEEGICGCLEEGNCFPCL